MSLLDRLFRRAPPAPVQMRPRLKLGAEHRLIYAIGDIHGRLDLLLELERLIEADRRKLGLDRTIILLGDLVDRGRQSAQVLDHVIDRQRAERRYLCLLGNHEDAMLGYLTSAGTDSWLRHGGLETLESYGVSADKLAGKASASGVATAFVPEEHIGFLAALPIAAETESYFFSHAGVRPGLPLDSQSDADLLWFKDGMRAQFDEFSKTIVHGHDAQTESAVGRRRINVDTGAFATGRLSCVRLLGSSPPVIIAAELPRTGRILPADSL